MAEVHGNRRSGGNAGETAIVDQSGAECGALSPENASIAPELQAIIDAWPSLSDNVKASVLALVRRQGEYRTWSASECSSE